MKPLRALLACACSLVVIGANTPESNFHGLLDRVTSRWDNLQSYTATWTAHEAEGSQVQDRVYHIFFEKPLNTRAEVVAGEGKGSVAVWTGGSRVRGHQGGILSLIKLNLDIHNKLAVSLRGATIADVNIGALLQHLRTIDPNDSTVSQEGSNSILSARVHDPPPDTDVVREVYVFEASGLPIEASQYDANDQLVKHVIFSDYKIDVSLPSSTWQV